MKKRILAALLAIAMLAAISTLMACGPGVAGDLDTYDFNTEKEVKIVFYHTMGEGLRTVLDKHIVKFNELYPNITVEHKQVGGYNDVREQIKTEITVGDQPNIAYCYPDHVALYNVAQVVQTLDNLIASEVEITRKDGTVERLGLTPEQEANFIKGFYEEGRQFGDGKMYTLPFSKSTEVLYYNKDFFEANNLTVPTTWDEMEATCKRIIEIDPDCIPLGYDSEANWFITMCEQMKTPYTSASGEHFLFDNEQNRAFVKRFYEWKREGYVTTQELSGGYTSALFTMDPAEKGNCYMCIGSSAGASHQIPEIKNDEDGTVSGYLFEVGIASIPQYNKEDPKVISQGPSVCIFKKQDPQEVLASWLFVKYLTTTLEFQADFGMESGYLPVLNNISDDAAYAAEMENANGFESLALLSTKVCLEQSKAYYTSPAFNGSSAARDEVGFLMQACMSINPAEVSDIDAKIKELFADAVAQCKYQAG